MDIMKERYSGSVPSQLQKDYCEGMELLSGYD